MQHQALIPAIGGHQADTATSGRVGAGGQAAPVRISGLAAGRPTQSEQGTQQGCHARPFQSGQAHDLARRDLEADVPELVADAEVADHERWRAIRVGRPATGIQGLLGAADHRGDDLGDGGPGELAGHHIPTIAHDGHVMAHGEHLLEPVRHIQHRHAPGGQVTQHAEEPLGLTLVERRVRLVQR